MDAVKKEIQQFYQAFIKTYLIDRDPQKTMEYFKKEQVFCVGTGAMEVAHDFDELSRQINLGLVDDPTPYKISWKDFVVTPIGTEGYYSVAAFYTYTKIIGEKVIELSARCTSIVQKCDGEWKILQYHTSTPLSMSAVGEFYPIRFEEERMNKQNFVVRKNILDLISCSNAGVISAYRKGDFPVYFINDRMLETLGYQSQEEFEAFNKGSLANAVHPEDIKKLWNTVDVKQEMGRVYSAEFRMRKKDGSYIWFIAYGNGVPLGDERIVMAVCLDITKQTDMKQKLIKTARDLKEASAELRDITNALPIGICTVRMDEKMTLLYASEGFYRLYGYTPEEFRERFNNEMIHILPQTTWKENNELIEIASAKDFRNYEYERQGIRVDGEIIWVINRGYYKRMPNGEMIAHCVVMDITDRKRAEEALKINEERFRVALEQTDSIVFEFDPYERTLTHLTKDMDDYHFSRMARNVPQSTVERKVIHPDFVDAFLRMYDISDAGEKTASCVIKARYDTNSPYRWVRFTLTNVFSEEGVRLKTIGVIEDVTDQKEIEIAYHQEEQVRNALLADALVCIEADIQNDVVTKCTSHHFPSIVKFEKDSYQGYINHVVETDIYPDDRELYLSVFSPAALKKAFADGTMDVKCEYRRKTTSGNIKWMLSTGHLVRDKETNSIDLIAYVRDIDKEKRETLALQYESERDALTGCYNKKSAQEHIKAHLASCNDDDGYIMMIIDIDHFKDVNDTYGHLYGDKVLAAFGSILNRQFRSNDIIGRLGGDEFVVLVKNTDSQWLATRKGREICDRFNGEFRDKNLSCSIGILISSGNQPFEKLYRRADVALYQAKKGGRNRCVFYQEEQESLTSSHEMLNMLTERVQNGIYEACLVPWRQIDKGTFMGVSVYLRDGVEKRLLIDQKTDIFLSSGAVRPIVTRYLFEQACRFIAERSKEGPTLAVASVELSWENIRELNLLPDLLAIVQDYGISPSRIQLDIPEEACEREREHLSEVCGALKKVGFRLGLSRFGSKYASLAILQEFGFGCVKLDRSVIRNWNSDDNNKKAMAESILQMCNRMNIEIALEGVDTELQRVIIEQYGCRYISGAVVGEPVVVDEAYKLR